MNTGEFILNQSLRQRCLPKWSCGGFSAQAHVTCRALCHPLRVFAFRHQPRGPGRGGVQLLVLLAFFWTVVRTRQGKNTRRICSGEPLRGLADLKPSAWIIRANHPRGTSMKTNRADRPRGPSSRTIPRTPTARTVRADHRLRGRPARTIRTDRPHGPSVMTWRTSPNQRARDLHLATPNVVRGSNKKDKLLLVGLILEIPRFHRQRLVAISSRQHRPPSCSLVPPPPSRFASASYCGRTMSISFASYWLEVEREEAEQDCMLHEDRLMKALICYEKYFRKIQEEQKKQLQRYRTNLPAERGVEERLGKRVKK